MNIRLVTEVSRAAYRHAMSSGLAPLASRLAMDTLINEIAAEMGHADAMTIRDVTEIRSRVEMLIGDVPAPTEKTPTELLWFFDAWLDDNLAMPHHAIIDAEGFAVVGMTPMTEKVAREICQSHNSTISG